MVLKVKARCVPRWGMNGANAAPVPASPLKTDAPETVVELIPYGCSRLRISEFPTVQPSIGTNMSIARREDIFDHIVSFRRFLTLLAVVRKTPHRSG